MLEETLHFSGVAEGPKIFVKKRSIPKLPRRVGVGVGGGKICVILSSCLERLGRRRRKNFRLHKYTVLFVAPPIKKRYL